MVRNGLITFIGKEGNVILTDDEKRAADVTGDGQVTMGDVVLLARFAAGTIEQL